VIATKFSGNLYPGDPNGGGSGRKSIIAACEGSLRRRGFFSDAFLNEKTYAIVDELSSIAQAHESTVARVALAWVHAQPGVSSTIIGARRLAQLEDNVKSLDIKLSSEELAQLDSLTKPTFGFPQNMQPWFPAIHNGGTSVNGVYAPPSSFGVEKGDKPY
jgi:aryl-alcohol dehydrogenase-like predicted oxidoreductase